jgi:hypothetical protein
MRSIHENCSLVFTPDAEQTELHDEEFSKLGEVHFQEVSLLQLLEFGTDGKKFNAAASLVAPEPLCWIGFRVDLGGSFHCPRGGNLASHHSPSQGRAERKGQVCKLNQEIP